MSQPAPVPSWKEEVNQRLAAHKKRLGRSETSDSRPLPPPAASDRAAQAAARVAARYAKAPSYSEMQAAEARAALRAAEAATIAALEAQAAAHAALETFAQNHPDQSLFDGPAPMATVHSIETYQQAEPTSQPPTPADTATRQPLQVRWEPDLPSLPPHTPAPQMHSQRVGAEPLSSGAALDETLEDSIREVEPALPIPANLIEFPRELVATRRVRPRTSTSEARAELYGQLSIFEVDPSTISIDPPAPAPQSAVTLPASAPNWTAGPEWSGIQLDEQPAEPAPAVDLSALPQLHLEIAPFSLRLIANIVDSSLVLGIVTGFAALAARYLHHLPGIRASEVAAAAAIFLTAVLYNALSFSLAGITPGMKFAGIALCTFENEVPTPAQVRTRLAAMLLSLLPVGLGAAWALFDDDHLCWHNRLSRIYLRECAGALLDNSSEF